MTASGRIALRQHRCDGVPRGLHVRNGSRLLGQSQATSAGSVLDDGGRAGPADNGCAPTATMAVDLDPAEHESDATTRADGIGTERRLRILMCAFACEPNRGSELGVGWNLAKAMATHHDVWVLTRTSSRDAIVKELDARPVPGLNFLYFDLPRWCGWLDRRGLGERAVYTLWQIFGAPRAARYVRDLDIDVVHHVTYNQYRGPLIGYFLSAPFLAGPVGGAESVPLPFYRDLSWGSRCRELVRRLAPDAFYIRLSAALRREPMHFVFSNEQTRARVAGNKRAAESLAASVLPAIAVDPTEFPAVESASDARALPPHDGLRLIYVGRAEDWKGLKVLLRAVAMANRHLATAQWCSLRIVGIREAAEAQRILGMATELGVADAVTLTPFLPRADLLRLFSSVDLFVYPAFRDSGSMAVLEASAMGCPSVFFDTPGQEHHPPEACVRVPMGESYMANVEAMAAAILAAASDRGSLTKIGRLARGYVHSKMTWSHHAAALSESYARLLAARRRS